MGLCVHVSSGFGEEAAAVLGRRLRRVAQVTSGKEPGPNAEVWVTGSASPAQLASLARLKAVVVPWAGVPESIAAALAAAPQASLHNLHHNAHATAEMAMALLHAAARQIPAGDAALRAGDWSMRFGGPAPMLLAGRRVLVLGWGAIGQRVGRACRALGMRVTGVRRSRRAEDPAHVKGWKELPGLWKGADAVMVCLPLTPETRGLVGAGELAALPEGAILVNIGRGPIVDEEALFAALESRRLGAAGIDVWYRYPSEGEACLPSRLPFHTLDNLVMSPHRAGAATEVESERREHLVRLIRRFAQGNFDACRVNTDLGY